jgi:hypothetical protein
MAHEINQCMMYVRLCRPFSPLVFLPPLHHFQHSSCYRISPVSLPKTLLLSYCTNVILGSVGFYKRFPFETTFSSALAELQYY